MSTEHSTNWPDLAIALYERLTGKNAAITYDFLDMHISVPSGTGPQAQHAEWVLRGKMKITTEDTSQSPN